MAGLRVTKSVSSIERMKSPAIFTGLSALLLALSAEILFIIG